MSKSRPHSLQDILKRRQREDFVGREEQLIFFRRNLRWEVDDPRRRFVINVSGQGGVGKTWLLRRFRKIAEEFSAVTAYTDETEDDVPAVMGRVAEQFEARGHRLKTFAERFKAPPRPFLRHLRAHRRLFGFLAAGPAGGSPR